MATKTRSRCDEYIELTRAAEQLRREASQAEAKARDILYPGDMSDSDDLLDTLILYRGEVEADGRRELSGIRDKIKGRIDHLKERGFFAEREPSFLVSKIRELVTNENQPVTYKPTANLSSRDRLTLERGPSATINYRIAPSVYPFGSDNYIFKLSSSDVAGDVTGERLFDHVRNELGVLPHDGQGEFIALPTHQESGNWRKRYFSIGGKITDGREVVSATRFTLNLMENK